MDKRFWIVIGIIVLIWISFFIFFYLKADEVTKDPCSICSKYMGKEVTCTTGKFIPITKVYYPNGTIYVDNPKIKFPEEKLNLDLSTLNVTT